MIKPVTLTFLVFQMLDIIITTVAVNNGIVWEVNPLGFNVVSVGLKFTIISLVGVVLEARNYSRMIWILPIISIGVVLWNITVILFEVL